MSSCRLCHAPLRTRYQVDPPERIGVVSAERECSAPECRALHDRSGRFLREHPATVLRRTSGG